MVLPIESMVSPTMVGPSTSKLYSKTSVVNIDEGTEGGIEGAYVQSTTVLKVSRKTFDDIFSIVTIF